MGRKGLFAEKPKKGPGRKARKQGDPQLTRQFKAAKVNKEETILSHHQKQRLVKRVQKQEEKKIKLSGRQRGKNQHQKQPKKVYNSESDDENDKSSEEEEEITDVEDDKAQGYTDDNNEWLKPKQNVNQAAETDSDIDDDDDIDKEEEDDDDEDVSHEESLDESSIDDEAEEMETDNDDDEDNLKIEKLENYSDDDENDDDLFKSDSESEDNDNDDDGNDDDEDLLPIEKKSKKLKIKQEEDAKLAEEELKLSIDDQEMFQFPDENAEDADKPITLQIVQQRVKDISVVLSDFKKYRQPNRSRQEYIDLLRKDLCMYYSYNEFLMEKLMEIFPVHELLEYLEASEVQRPLTIRTNSLKARRRDLAAALINRGVNLDPLGKWTKVGLVVYNSTVPLGATPEYLAGHYMIQGASSLLPVMALAPQENERILDLCSAPGGKSSHIAALMKNTGVLFSNDANKDRIKAVVGNFHRLGVINAVVSCEDGCKFKSIMTGFDRILVDAPCTGTGVIAKDPSVKTSKSEVDIQRCYNLQRKLLLTAIDCLSAKSPTGGYLVYSTCSILPEENEWVIDYVLKKRNVKLVSTGLGFGTEGFVNYRHFRFHPSMKLTRRYYPHTHNMDGFFVAKLKKFSDVIPSSNDNDNEAVISDEKESVTNDAMVNGNEIPTEDGKKGKWSGKPEQSQEAKKRKQQEDEKKYVAKVFEKPQAVKKVKKHEKSKSKQNGTVVNKQGDSTIQSSAPISNKKQKNKKLANKQKVLSGPQHKANASTASKIIKTENTLNTNSDVQSSRIVKANGSPAVTKAATNKKEKKKIANKPESNLVIQKGKKKLEIETIPQEQVTKIKNKIQKSQKKQIGQLKTKAASTNLVEPKQTSSAAGVAKKHKNKNKNKK